MGPLNSRYEKFAQMVAGELTGSEAYCQGAGATAGKNADVLAARWMDSPGVRQRLNELKEANSRNAPLSREQTIEFPVQCHQHLGRRSRRGLFARAIRRVRERSASEAPHPRQDRGGEGTDQDVRMGPPNRIELSTRDTLAEFIDSIRQAPRRPGMAAYAEDNGVHTAI